LQNIGLVLRNKLFKGFRGSLGFLRLALLIAFVVELNVVLVGLHHFGFTLTQKHLADELLLHSFALSALVLRLVVFSVLESFAAALGQLLS
jgi:hypothetical protein